MFQPPTDGRFRRQSARFETSFQGPTDFRCAPRRVTLAPAPDTCEPARLGPIVQLGCDPRPVVQPAAPVHAESSAYWEASSWDRTQVPKPFSRVAFVVGPPIDVGRDSANSADESTAALLAALARAEERSRQSL